MKQTLWERAQQLFGEALQVPSGERAIFVERACGADSELREEVESLLAHDVTQEAGAGALEGLFQFAALTLLDEGSLIGRRVGAYRIESELGHGGMGTVYLAVRADDEFNKRVAIKVVKKGMDTRTMLERFRYERQILANLDHPYIARLMDGGSTVDHQPFFVMEYVEGQPIDEYCRESHLGVKDICRLFLRVCEAVTYAHRNLVVHRDLKPSNIIVTADGAPKLLDFGVARVVSPDADPDATVTGLFQRPFTPQYASPEQMLGLSVSTATDVYSLGAVLYELLTGSRIHHVTSNTASDWQKAVCEGEVPRPSLRRRELRGDLDNILLMALRKEPERRYSSVEQLASDVARYLEGRPVAARQDSFRYRAGKYLRRHRVSIAAAGLVAASLLVSAVLAVAEARDSRAARLVAEQARALAEKRSRQADAARLVSEHEHLLAEQAAGVARSEQKRAEQRLSQMVELANKSLFDVHMAIERLPGATAARQRIVKTTLEYLESLEKEAGDDPRLRIALGAAYLRVGEIQGSPNAPSLGDTTGAARSLDRAAAWMKPVMGIRPPDPNVLAVWIDIQRARAELMEAIGRNAESIRIAKSLLPDAALLSKLSPDDGREANLHEVLLKGLESESPAEAIEHARLGVAGFTKLVERDPADADNVLALSAIHSLWGSVLRGTDMAGALEQYRESARLREDLIKKYPNNSGAQRGLMLVYGQIASVLGDSFQLTKGTDVEGARVYYGKAAVIAHALAAADPVNRVAQYDLASVELRLGALDPKPGAEAESLASLERARVLFEDLIRSDSKAVRYQSGMWLTYEYIGHRLRDAGKPAEALAFYRKSLAVAESAFSANPKDTQSIGGMLAAEVDMADLLARTGERAGAIDYAGRSVEQAERLLRGNETPVRHIRLAQSYEAMAGVRKQLGDWAEARAAAILAAAQWRAVTGVDSHVADVARMEGLVAECDGHLRP